MRRFACTLLVLPLLGSVKADEPRVLIERSLKAMGGADAVKQRLAVHMKVKGQFAFGKAEGEYYRWGERYKLILDVRFADNGPMRVTLVSDGDKLWVESNGQILTENTKDDEEQRVSRHVDRVTDLVELLADKGFTLTSLPDAKVEGRPTSVIKVSYKGQPDTNLHFDKQTDLLVKYSYRAKNADTRNEVLHETILSDYREPDLAAADEKLLRDAKIDVSGPALLAFIRTKIVSPERLAKARALIRQLGDDSFRLRERASKELVALGSMALPLLREAEKDMDREVARRARDCLERIGEQGNQTQIAAAIRLLALRKPSGATEALLDYLPTAEGDVAKDVRAVLFVLAQKDGKPDPVLVRALDDKDPARRQAAAAALGKDGGAYARQPGRRVFGPVHKIAMKVRRWTDGNKDHELETYDYQLFNAFADRMFTRP